MNCKGVPKSKAGKFFVLYKGDDIISTGTIEEINKNTGIKIENLVWLTYAAAARREAKSKRGRLVMVEG